jgi:dihydropteroate synthase
MGIINLSTDSFYAGSIAENSEALIAKVAEMQESGMNILDIGAASSRPGAIPLSADAEWKILEPILDSLRTHDSQVLISIDTYHKEVIERALAFKINIVNDISGFEKSEELIEFISDKSLPYILMHKQGDTRSMQDNPTYKNVTLDLLGYFKKKISLLRKYNIEDVIVDPGFGFGKTVEHNYELLRKLEVFALLECPLLVGVSRKSMIYKTLNVEANEALNGTSALHMLALANGANILRVHDVKEAKECIKLFQAYKSS